MLNSQSENTLTATIATAELISFDHRYLDELEANNYFGSDDGDVEFIQPAWINSMESLGYELGNEYDEDGFDSAAQKSLEAAINQFNAEKRL